MCAAHHSERPRQKRIFIRPARVRANRFGFHFRAHALARSHALTHAHACTHSFLASGRQRPVAVWRRWPSVLTDRNKRITRRRHKTRAQCSSSQPHTETHTHTRSRAHAQNVFRQSHSKLEYTFLSSACASQSSAAWLLVVVVAFGPAQAVAHVFICVNVRE